MKKIGLIVFAVTIAVLNFQTAAFCELYKQQDQLFSMDIPEQWKWNETKSEVSVVPPQGENQIGVIFGPITDDAGLTVKTRLDMAAEQMAGMLKKNYGSKSNPQIESVTFSGLEARKLTFKVNFGKDDWRDGVQYFLVRGNLRIAVTYGSGDAEEIQAMKQAVDTFKFLN